MRRAKKAVAAAVERIEAVACTTIGDEPREVTLRPNDLRRLVDGLDDAAERDARQRAEIRRLKRTEDLARRFLLETRDVELCETLVERRKCAEVACRLWSALHPALAPKRRARK